MVDGTKRSRLLHACNVLRARALADTLGCARYNMSCAICDVMHAKLELFPVIKLHEAR